MKTYAYIENGVVVEIIGPAADFLRTSLRNWLM